MKVSYLLILIGDVRWQCLNKNGTLGLDSVAIDCGKSVAYGMQNPTHRQTDRQCLTYPTNPSSLLPSVLVLGDDVESLSEKRK